MSVRRPGHKESARANESARTDDVRAGDTFAPGMRVVHARYGSATVEHVQSAHLSVRLDADPHHVRELARAEFRLEGEPAAAMPRHVEREARRQADPAALYAWGRERGGRRVARKLAGAGQRDDGGPVTRPARAREVDALMVQLRDEVEEVLFEEGVEPEFTYAYDPPTRPRRAPRPLRIDRQVGDLFAQVEGITRFYSHQIATRRHLLAGDDVVICTPTASGKTESYNPTILETLLNDPQATALYLFPLVALGMDQLERLQRLNQALPPTERLELGIYNNSVDRALKEHTRLADNRMLVTTPESLHWMFLPKPYENWRRFFKNLRYVVLDEAHVYRGVLGAHMANIVRRLLIRCRREGAPDFPQLILSSATVRYPRQLAQQLTGLPEERFAVVERSGAPQPGRHYLVTRDDIHNLIDLCADLLQVRTRDARSGELRPARTIVFVRSIEGVKRATRQLREHLRREGHGGLARTVAGFYSERADKGQVFADLRRGKIRCLFTTTALMAGIDVGSLDVSIVKGFPGMVMDARQMFGRAGRTADGAAIFYASRRDPFDQFYLERPAVLFSGETEDVVADPENPYLLAAHIKCAAQVVNGKYRNQEGPLPVAWAGLFGEMGEEIINYYLQQGVLRSQGGYLYLQEDDPHDVEPLNNLRSLERAEYVLRTPQGEELERKREANAFRDAHPGAIVWAQGSYYKVLKLDRKRREIVCVPTATPDTRTRGIQQVRVQPRRSNDWRSLPPLDLLLAKGKVTLTTGVGEYALYQQSTVMQCRSRRCRHQTPDLDTQRCPVCGGPLRLRQVEKVLDTYSLDEGLATTLDTRATWLYLSELVEERFEAEFWPRWNTTAAAREEAPPAHPTYEAALHGVVHALLKAFPEHVRCDRDEVNGLYVHSPEAGTRLYLYDNFPGGLGLAESFFTEPEALLALALHNVERCTCDEDEGCPVCLSYFGCAQFNRGLSKFGARYLLRLIQGKPLAPVLADLRDYVAATVPTRRQVDK